ncbi:MAG TPA: hypothetical protein PLX33_09840 [Alphaproteobacteria bacterium]|nr:hypothetical protein [Alphaproteobacteria bacterium]
MTDLFGKATASKPTATRSPARASGLPGPVGEKCRSCRHAYGIRNGKKTYFKCGIAKRAATSGPGTDIRLKDPACARWEAEALDVKNSGNHKMEEK